MGYFADDKTTCYNDILPTWRNENCAIVKWRIYNTRNNIIAKKLSNLKQENKRAYIKVF